MIQAKTAKGAVEKLCADASTSFIAQASTCFRESPFLNLQLEPCGDALVLAEQCSATNMSHYRSSI